MSDQLVLSLRLEGDGSRLHATLNLAKEDLERLRQAGGLAGGALDVTASAAGRAGDAMTRGARQATGQLQTLRDVAGQVRGVLAGLGLTFGAALWVRETIQATIAMQNLESRLERMTGSAARAAQEQEWLQDTASRLSTDLVTLGDNWARLLNLVNSGVISLGQGRQLLEGFADVAAATGAGPQQIGQAMYGLAQGLSAGVLRAEEFNQVTEPLVGLTNALDRAFVKVTGSTEQVAGAMRHAVNEGKVTSELFATVLVSALQEYSGAAEEMGDNLQQQLTRVRNEWTLLLDAFAAPATDGGGLLDDVTDALRWARENIELTRIAVLGLGSAFVIALSGRAIVGAVSTLAGLFGALLNPLGLLVAGATALGVILHRVSDDGVDAAAAVDSYREALRKMEDARVAGESGNETLARQLRTVAEVAMAAAEAIRGIALAHYQARISELRQQLASLPSELEIERTTTPSAAQRQRAETRAAVEGELSKLLADPDYKALQNPQSIRLPAPTEPEDPAVPTLPGKGGAKNALRDLLEELDPMRGALREFAEDQALLDAALRKGAITLGDHALLTAQLRDRYREALDPLGTLLDQYRQEIDLLSLSADERTIQQALIQAEQELRAKGVELGAAELDQLRQMLIARRQAEAAAASRQRTGEMADQLALVQAEIDLQGVGRAERELKLALMEKELELRRQGLDLSSREAQAELEATEQLYRKRKELEGLQEQQEEIEDAFERGFDRIGEAITQAFADGSIEAIDFGQIAKSVLSEILQEMLRILILNPLKKAFGEALSGIGAALFGGGGGGSGVTTTNVIGGGGGLFQTFVGSAHGGGQVDQIAGGRGVDPRLFLGAGRFHRGGTVPGLMPGEVPIIAQSGEEVLTREDPRNRRNGAQAPKVEVHIHEASGTRTSVRERRQEDGGMRLDVLVELVDEAQAQRVARGDSRSAQAMERRYGLNRSLGELG